MTSRSSHALDLRDHVDRAVHGLARQPRRDDRDPGDPHRPRRLARGARVDGQRLHAHLRGPAPHRRRARRPLRSPSDVRDRARRSSRSARSPPRSRRTSTRSIVARAVQGLGGALVMPLTLTILSAAVPPERRGVALGAWGGDRRSRDRVRPARRRRRRRGHLVAVDLLAQRPDRHRARPARAPRLSESLRPGRPARPAAGSRSSAPACSAIVWGLVRGERRGLGEPADRRLARRRRAPARRVRRCGSSGRRAPMLPMRFFRNRPFSLANAASLFMFFGMFGSIFLLAQFFQTVQGYSPLESGLRILPWTLAPMFVAPDRGRALRPDQPAAIIGTGLTLQAVGARVDRGGLDADHPVRRADRARSSSPASAWRSSSHRSRTSCSRRRPAAGGGPGVGCQQRDPRARRRLRRRRARRGLRARRAATRARRRSVDGMTTAVYVGAAVVGLGALAAFAIPGAAAQARRSGAAAGGARPTQPEGAWVTAPRRRRRLPRRWELRRAATRGPGRTRPSARPTTRSSTVEHRRRDPAAERRRSPRPAARVKRPSRTRSSSSSSSLNAPRAADRDQTSSSRSCVS